MFDLFCVIEQLLHCFLLPVGVFERSAKINTSTIPFFFGIPDEISVWLFIFQEQFNQQLIITPGLELLFENLQSAGDSVGLFFNLLLSTFIVDL